MTNKERKAKLESLRPHIQLGAGFPIEKFLLSEIDLRDAEIKELEARIAEALALYAPNPDLP